MLFSSAAEALAKSVYLVTIVLFVKHSSCVKRCARPNRVPVNLVKIFPLVSLLYGVVAGASRSGLLLHADIQRRGVRRMDIE